jgi:hypothetical protein
MSWIGALKFWNKEKGPIITDTANVYILPRKGTEEYKEVKAVQQGEEMPAKKKEREARNKATMDKALGQLRAVEAETKARNVERKKEAKVVVEQRAQEAAKRATEQKAQEAAKRAAQQKAETAVRIAEQKAGEAAKGGSISGVSELPEDLQLNIKGFVGDKSTGWNLANLFMAGKQLAQVNAPAILIVMDAISFGEGGNQTIFFESTADSYPLLKKDNLNRSVSKSIFEKWGKKGGIPMRGLRGDVYGYELPFNEPNSTQMEILNNGFPQLKINIVRRVGGIGGKAGIKFTWEPKTSGINLRTKEGKANVKKILEESAESAKTYLARIEDKAEPFWDFLTKQKKRAIEARQKARESSSFKIPATKASAEFVSPDRFEDVYLAFFGDAEKAKKRADELRKQHPNKRMKFFGRRNLNIIIEK